MSCDVGPAGLATTRMPSSAGRLRPRRDVAARRSAAQRTTAAASRLRLGEDRGPGRVERQRHGRAGRAGVAAAAEPAGQHGRIDAARAASGR